MTDDPSIHAMALAKSRLQEQDARIAALEETLREAIADLQDCGEELGAGPLSGLARTISKAFALLNKETSRA